MPSGLPGEARARRLQGHAKKEELPAWPEEGEELSKQDARQKQPELPGLTAPGAQHPGSPAPREPSTPEPSTPEAREPSIPGAQHPGAQHPGSPAPREPESPAPREPSTPEPSTPGAQHPGSPAPRPSHPSVLFGTQVANGTEPLRTVAHIPQGLKFLLPPRAFQMDSHPKGPTHSHTEARG
ncbi:PREDICTED: proline-rich protein 2-like [Dipodomys ordii]|uniref:Proline-rich protein 2-like n=1 Tax=Dipodomys ordii TaxID=10020 RepID=A0A1S3EYI4_DIPOR|nr:PREDICTED: proline-rich protein 2-like [Dipodomys ordii]